MHQPAETRETATGPRWRRPTAVALLAMLVMGFIMVSTSALEGMGWSSFVVAGSDFVDEMETPEELQVYPDTIGYDGQQFYRLSRHPLSTEAVVEGIPLDDGPYRQQRILYPVTAWTVSAVTGVSTLISLPLVNLLGVGLLAAAVAVWARRQGRSPWFGIVVAILPPMYFGTTRNLSEPLALALMVVGIMMWRRNPWWGAGILTMAVMSRETTIVAAAGFGIAALARSWHERSMQPLRDHGLPAALPLIVLLSWQAWLSRAWGTPSVGGAAERVEAPVWGVFTTLFAINPDIDVPTMTQRLWSLEQILLLGALGVALWLALRTGNVDLPLQISLVLAIIVGLMPSASWQWAAAFTRAAGEAIILGALVALCAGERFRLYFWPMGVLILLVRLTG